MTRTLVAKTAAITFTLFFMVTPARAEEPHEDEIKPGDSDVALNVADRQAMTLEVMKAYPMLSASPGIKSAQAWRGPSKVVATVIYYPHSDSGGTKYAFQAHCERQISGEAWSCPEVETRRYLQLDSQDFEVRVTGDIANESARALIQATRRIAKANATESSTLPNTAIMIFPVNSGYVVSWGSPEGFQKLHVKADLRQGGNPANSDDWDTRLFQLGK